MIILKFSLKWFIALFWLVLFSFYCVSITYFNNILFRIGANKAMWAFKTTKASSTYCMISQTRCKSLKIPSVTYHPNKQGHWFLSKEISFEEHSSMSISLALQRASVESLQIPSEFSFPRGVVLEYEIQLFLLPHLFFFFFLQWIPIGWTLPKNSIQASHSEIQAGS